MSFREKTAWIGMVSLLGIIVWYFWPFLHTGQHGTGLALGRLAIVAAIIMIAQLVVRLAVTAFAPKEAKAPPDEREKLIEMKGRRFSYAVLAWAVRIICFVGIANPSLFFNANTLLFSLMISEVLGVGYQIVQFRRGV